MKTSTRSIAVLSLAVAATVLTGCAAAVVGGAAAAGGMVATDRRSSATQLADQAIELRASSAINDVLGDKRGHVSVTSYYRKVLVTGEVATQEARQRAGAAVAATPDVASVINELAVMPESSLKQRSEDTLVTGRVKAKLIDANGVPSNSIKVVTERGTVYLMGRLTEREEALATEVARTTPGVQRVVRIIDRISEQAALHPNDASGQTPAPAPVTTVPSSGAAATPTAPAVEVHPVTQPTVIQQPPVEVRPLPPVK